MLHFFARYTDDAARSPFTAELDRLGVPFRMFSRAIDLRYRTPAGLVFGVYPRLARYALANALRSLRSRPRPTAAVVGSDVEALAFGLVRAVLRARTAIVFQTLIITQRRSRLLDGLYRRYYALVLSVVDVAICHSSVEIARYAALYPRARCRFAFVPFGITVEGREALMGPGEPGLIVTAGRSGRDYATLVAAIAGLACRLEIICDTQAAVAGIAPSAQVRIRPDVFGDAYFATLARAQIVVVPLGVADVSAGQMVLLQASALAKPVVLTRTAGTAEYAADGKEAMLVAPGSVPEMRAAIGQLLSDAALRTRIGTAAADRFARDHSTEAYVRTLVATLAAVA